MAEGVAYTDQWFAGRRKGARRSAEIVVDVLLDLIGHPSSVVDVGCGTGSWLAVFRDRGIEDVLGIDGSYVDRSQLEIPVDRFLPRDLREPLHLDRTFGLAISLEVAEHLPPGSAEGFVDSLAALAPVILFSAAVPHQGGTGHLNEQWQDEWAERFRARGFTVVDALRPRIWNTDGVKVFYRQNTLLYVRSSELDSYPDLERIAESDAMPLRVIHPKHYVTTVGQFPPPGLVSPQRFAYFVGRILGLSRLRRSGRRR